MRGATVAGRMTARRSAGFQSTHPMRGATVYQVAHPRGYCNFNPRTPCGVRRRQDVGDFRDNRFQSTHPMRGATCALRQVKFKRFYFNPRTPCGVRHSLTASPTLSIEFQSTHPMRGATDDVVRLFRRNPISIHAPHAGCDRHLGADHHGRRDFNPRTPCGVRPFAFPICLPT